MRHMTPSLSDEDFSDIPVLQVPSFSSTVPEPLKESCDPTTRYILDQISIITQQQEYLIRVMVDSNKQQRRTNGQVKQLRGWREQAQKQIKAIEEADENFGPIREWVTKVTHGWRGILFLAGLVVTGSSALLGLTKIIDWLKET